MVDSVILLQRHVVGCNNVSVLLPVPVPVRRSTSSAVRIWQPQTVVRRHEQFLEQQTVSPDTQILELEQELQDCLLQVRVLSNSLVSTVLFCTVLYSLR